MQGAISKFNVIRIIKVTTASDIAYGLNKKSKKEENLFDFSGVAFLS